MRAEERAVVQDEAEHAAQPEMRHEVGVRPAYVTHRIVYKEQSIRDTFGL